MANQRLYGDKATRKCNFHLLVSHYNELDRLAKLEGKSVAALLRELIASFLRDDKDGAGSTSRRK